MMLSGTIVSFYSVPYLYGRTHSLSVAGRDISK